MHTHYLIDWIGNNSINREADLSYSPMYAPPASVNVEVCSLPSFLLSSCQGDKYLVVCLGLCHLCHRSWTCSNNGKLAPKKSDLVC